VFRALANSLLSLLLLTTLVWGGCISCEQYFMLPGVKSCCGAHGQCKTKKPAAPQNSGRECKQIAFDDQKSIDLHIDLPVIPIHGFALPEPLAAPLNDRSDLNPVEPSPPDWQALHSTFLI
jgi:hypothetical protein